MKQKYQLMFLALIIGVFAWPTQDVRAQAGDTLWVEYLNSNGDVVVNALRDAIANDTNRPANRVYGLYRGGLYYNSEIIYNNGFHLNIAGQASAPAGEEDFGPAVIQMVLREDGTAPGRIIVVQDDLTLRNVWVTGQDDAGARSAYLPIFVEVSGKRIVVDNCVMERTNFSIIGLGGADNSVYITNSKFRNHDNTSQQWEGRGIRFEAGGDSLVMENNTFLNFGMTIVQSETAPIDYVRFNHNTVVNLGRSVNAGSIWQSAFFTNNLVVNGFWHGEGGADYNQPNRQDEYTGIFGIADLPPAYGTNLGRRIVYSNNSHWRDPQFDVYYADSIRAQPMFNATTQEFFDEYQNINAADNLWQVNPNLVSYTQAPVVSEFPETSYPLSELVPRMIDNMRDLRESRQSPFTSWLWDPGRDPEYFEGAGFVWPLPENMSYSNNDLMAAGTDGLPLGDLNWFPAAKATFEANKASYIAEIESMAEAPVVTPVGAVEAEDGTAAEGAELVGYDYPVFIALHEGPTITWTYDAPAAGTYTLSFHYRLTGGEKGQKLTINGNYVPADQSDHMFTGANGEWLTKDIDVELVEGANEIRLIKSWGWMDFGDVDVKQAGTTITTLPSIAAVLDGDVTFNQVNSGDPAPPSGWYHVSLAAAGNKLTIPFEAATAGTHAIALTYMAETDQQVQVSVNGTVAQTVTLEATDGSWENGAVNDLTFTAGVNQIEILAVGGGVSVDKMDVFKVTSTATEEDELPEGYALNQNYPNPFNPATTIEFTVPATGSVRLAVYDVMGRLINVLVDRNVTAGTFRATWNGTNASGNLVASGVYFYRLETEVGQMTKTMVLLK